MTIPEAQVFVRRWRRVRIPWLDLPDAVAARAMERAFLSIAISPLPAIFAFIICGSFPLSRWPLGVLVPTVVIMLSSYWMSLRFRAARRLFEGADAQHLSDLR